MFLQRVGQIKTSVLAVGNKAVKLSSLDVQNGTKAGRHAVEVCNPTDSIVYIGGEDVSVANGIAVYAKSSRFIPVAQKATETVYIVSATSVNVVLAEYFE